MEFVRVSGLEPGQSELFEAWAQVFIDAALADNGESDERSATDLREMERNPDVGRRLMAVLDEGRVVERGKTLRVFADPQHDVTRRLIQNYNNEYRR